MDNPTHYDKYFGSVFISDLYSNFRTRYTAGYADLTEGQRASMLRDYLMQSAQFLVEHLTYHSGQNELITLIAKLDVFFEVNNN